MGEKPKAKKIKVEDVEVKSEKKQKKRQTLQWKQLRMLVSWRKVVRRKRRKRKRKMQSNFYHTVHYLLYVSNLYSVWKKSFGTQCCQTAIWDINLRTAVSF